jgi:hypothetical protein
MFVALLALLLHTPLSDAACADEASCRAEAQAKLQRSYARDSVGQRWPSRCERVTAPPTAASFYASLTRGVPVVFANGTSHFGALGRWADLGYVARRFGETEHEVSVFDAREGGRKWGIHPWETDAMGTMVLQPHKRTMALAAVLAEATEEYVLFAEQDPLFDRELGAEQGFPDGVLQREMWADVMAGGGGGALPPWLEPFAELQSANFWFGRLPRGSGEAGGRPKESALHFDPLDNLLAQVKGRKKFVLFAPGDSAALHPGYMVTGSANDPRASANANAGGSGGEDGGAGEEEEEGDAYLAQPRDARLTMEWDNPDEIIENFSPVDISRPNLTRYPLFRGARPCVCAVEPGDVLYLPAFTWHNVFSWGDAADQTSMALNFWWTQSNAVEEAQGLLLNTLRGLKPEGGPRALAAQLGLEVDPRAGAREAEEKEDEQGEDEEEQREEEQEDDIE